MIKLACTDISLNSHYGLSIVLFTFGLVCALILLSYVPIFRSVLAIASPRDRLDTLNTGVSHVLAVLIFYVPMVSVSIVHRFGAGLPHAVHTLFPDQGRNLCLLHWQADSFPLSHRGSPVSRYS